MLTGALYKLVVNLDQGSSQNSTALDTTEPQLAGIKVPFAVTLSAVERLSFLRIEDLILGHNIWGLVRDPQAEDQATLHC